MKTLLIIAVLSLLAACSSVPRTPLEEYKFQQRMAFSKKMAAQPSLFDFKRR